MVTPTKIHPNHWHITTWKLAIPKSFKTQQAKSLGYDFGNLPKCQWIPKVWTPWSFSKKIWTSHCGELPACHQSKRSMLLGGCRVSCFFGWDMNLQVFSMVKAHTKKLFNKMVQQKGCQLEINWMIGPLFHWKGLFFQEKSYKHSTHAHI